MGRSRQPQRFVIDGRGREAVPGTSPAADQTHKRLPRRPQRAPGGGECGGSSTCPGESHSAIHRDFGPGPGIRWAQIVRRGLLRAGRHGESDKACTPDGSVCGPHVLTRKLAGNQLRVVFLGIRLPRDDGDGLRRVSRLARDEAVACGLAELDPLRVRLPEPIRAQVRITSRKVWFRLFRELSVCGALLSGSLRRKSAKNIPFRIVSTINMCGMASISSSVIPMFNSSAVIAYAPKYFTKCSSHSPGCFDKDPAITLERSFDATTTSRRRGP